jgi:AcrR family transcriptional regulator
MSRHLDTKATILEHTARLLAAGGPGHVSLRRVGQATNLAQSAVYHHFSNKDELLEAAQISIRQTLRADLMALPATDSTRDLLVQRINYQFDHAAHIVAILKYFMANREKFPELAETGYLPARAYQHIIDVLDRGNQTGEFEVADPRATAKVIVHAVNGFVLEYFPARQAKTERTVLVESIADFVWKSLTNISHI